VSTLDQAPTYTNEPSGWFARSEAWLDSKGKGAWIAAMVLGFIFVWPVGLALLFYMIWSKRMFSRHHRGSYGLHGSSARHGFSAMRPSGNNAFDAYKADTLRRLEDEQHSFEDFLQRLRDAKDKAEFDEFMDDRASASAAASSKADEKEDA
jgi:predicted CopG family antitoxin